MCKTVPSEVQQLANVAVPLKGQLCALSTPKGTYEHFRVVICTLIVTTVDLLGVNKVKSCTQFPVTSCCTPKGTHFGCCSQCTKVMLIYT